LAESREKARAFIMAGLVEVGGVRMDKPGHTVPESVEIFLHASSPPYVSRGGLKLAEAFERFPLDVRGRTVMDVGASTGGFTDCLLQNGASRVIAVDVGHGQFHWTLRNDPRVRLMERTNIRYLRPEDLGEPVQGAVIDVSFISLKIVVPVVGRLLEPGAWMVTLVKPQFEVGRERVGKGGVVRDPELHARVLEELTERFRSEGWSVKARTESPVLGPKGNREFLLHLQRIGP
jgi:23S rRNA (cytidine1920-2'-O)/16S rRNA (cytidine1409-2'-O)-methyltransferase